MLNNSTLAVKILTPSGSVFNDESTMILLPAVTGEVGVLPGHVPMIFRLDPGIIKVYQNEKLHYETFVFGGFAKIDQDEVYILVDKVSKVNELDFEEANRDLVDIEKKLLDNTNIKLFDILESKIRTLRKILELSKSRH